MPVGGSASWGTKIKVCGREIGMNQLFILLIDRHDLTQPTHFKRVLNFKCQGSFHCITCVGGDSASTLVAQNFT